MILLRFLVTTLVTSCNFSKLNVLSSFTYFGSDNDAKLQTATSSGAVYSMISVHKLDDLMVPRCF